MSSLALAPPGSPRHGGGQRASQSSGVAPEPSGVASPSRVATPSLLDELGGEPNLDEVLTGVWEGLAAHRTVACPVCGEAMKPAYGAHARPIGGRCDGCRASLS